MEDYAGHYRYLHQSHKMFRGYSIHSAAPTIARLVKSTGARSLLDYGCGKGMQYSERKVHLEWGGLMPVLYDVGVEAFSKKPSGRFDGIICTDVMEHIAERDVPFILADVVSYIAPRDDGQKSFIAFWISCRPAKSKKLRDGRNVHLTVRGADWWNKKIWDATAHIRDHCLISAEYEMDDVK